MERTVGWNKLFLLSWGRLVTEQLLHLVVLASDNGVVSLSLALNTVQHLVLILDFFTEGDSQIAKARQLTTHVV